MLNFSKRRLSKIM